MVKYKYKGALKRYRPEFRETGKKTWSGYHNNMSYGARELAEDFITKTRLSYKKANRRGAFRIKTIYVVERSGI